MANKTFIAMVLDETGSMSFRRQTAIESTNEFLAAHSEIPNCYASLVTFDKVAYWGMEHKTDREQVRFLHEGVAIKDIPALTEEQYNPHGMTNLYDAIGATIKHLEVVSKTDPDATVIVMINTDGDENASTEFTGEAVKQLIKEKKELNWEFVFIAEELGEDRARGMANNIGITSDMTLNVTGANKKGMFNAMASATTAYACDAGVRGAKGPQGDIGTSGITLKAYMDSNLPTGDA